MTLPFYNSPPLARVAPPDAQTLAAALPPWIVPDDGQTYRLTGTVNATGAAVRLDTAALADRVAVLVRNVGANLVEYALNNAQFLFGTGDQIAANGGVQIFVATADVQIWIAAAANATYDLRVTELGWKRLPR